MLLKAWQLLMSQNTSSVFSSLLVADRNRQGREVAAHHSPPEHHRDLLSGGFNSVKLNQLSGITRSYE